MSFLDKLTGAFSGREATALDAENTGSKAKRQQAIRNRGRAVQWRRGEADAAARRGRGSGRRG